SRLRFAADAAPAETARASKAAGMASKDIRRLDSPRFMAAPSSGGGCAGAIEIERFLYISATRARSAAPVKTQFKKLHPDRKAWRASRIRRVSSLRSAL